ncbi:MAG TPA: PhzF family phenazine biosynthesis protein, partial [Longimicrobiales bacterium]|nr:PhzF family phenazine biosynthesis protein [Longimicrobiales bacterium]
GHATLASAHALWELQLAARSEPLRFHTRSGVLTARHTPAGIVLDFPAEPATTVPWVMPLLEALGIPVPVAFARNRFDYLVEVADAAQVRDLQPDMVRLAEVPTRGVVVTARADSGDHDFISRWFGPRVGVDEDPVTGSAHCCLGRWWAERLGRTEMRGVQASPRGGTVGVRVLGDRVELTGSAVTVLPGELTA